MIKLKINFTIKHINIYLIKNKTVILNLSTKNLHLDLFRTNNLSALNILSKILILELKFSGINEPITFECKQFKGKIINFVKILTDSKIPVLVKIVKV